MKKQCLNRKECIQRDKYIYIVQYMSKRMTHRQIDNSITLNHITYVLTCFKAAVRICVLIFCSLSASVRRFSFSLLSFSSASAHVSFLFSSELCPFRSDFDLACGSSVLLDSRINNSFHRLIKL